ncbi:hypothetical protein VE00_10475 [Pseudogymnoascus sp. WSF 3629]|nr:hypothetical protein VE00_10475 [Pseudogymnoascus sp. WSF 3629]
MARPDLDDNSELSILDTSDVDKAVRSVVRWLRNENTTRYFEQHLVARDAIVIAVREVTHSTALATPISTPYNAHTPIDQALTHLSPPYIAHEESDPVDQTSTLLLPLHIAQAERGDSNDSTDLHKLSGEAPDQTSLAAQQELENGSHPPDHSSIEHGEKLYSEHATSDSQHSASLGVSTPAARDKPRKRKHNLEGRELGEKGLQRSEQTTSQPVPIRDEQFGQQAAVTSRHSSESPSATESATKLPEGESDRFVELLADLRAKLHTIGDESTLATIMDYAEYTADPPTSADYCADTLEEYQNPDTTSDQRFRVLRNRIVRDEAEEEIVKYLRFNIRISKLFALAELSIRYSEEKEARSAVPRKRRKKELPRLSPKDRFTDLLFPEIGNIEEEGERNVARKEAKGTFSY